MTLELTNDERISLILAVDSYLVTCEMREDKNPLHYQEQRAMCQALAKRLDALIEQETQEL